jgi:endoglycosylceramidase
MGDTSIALLLSVLCIVTCSGFVKVDLDTKQLIDDEGRSRIFHGVNVVYKSPPYYPPNGKWSPQYSLDQTDYQFLVKSGFSVVRLFVAWPGVEPVRGAYNYTYLNVLEKIVNDLGALGIYTILDCHQDLLSPKFCGEGAPDFAALYKNSSRHPLDFPIPVPSLFPFKVDPATGYPTREECNKHKFFLYYFSDACAASWQSFYDNEQGVQDAFVKFWQVVATKFKDNKNLLGYELLNEPWAGDIYSNPDQLAPHVSDDVNLAPLYKKLHEGIRQVDNEHILFFEPTVIITELPLETFSTTGLKQGPGGPAYNDRQVYSFHLYCILMDSHGEPLDNRLCRDYEQENFKIRTLDLNKLGTAGFMTEWGAYGTLLPGSKEYNDGVDVLNLADQHLTSWSYWQYKGFGDFTTQSSDTEGLFYPNGTAQEAKLKLLSRTYAQSLAGEFISQSFDPSTSSYALMFKVRKNCTAPSIVYLSEDIYYPAGYSVNVSPIGSVSVSSPRTNYVTLTTAEATQDKQIVSVTIKKK